VGICCLLSMSASAQLLSVAFEMRVVRGAHCAKPLTINSEPENWENRNTYSLPGGQLGLNPPHFKDRYRSSGSAGRLDPESVARGRRRSGCSEPIAASLVDQLNLVASIIRIGRSA
jgi:hypothetical protein